MAEEASPWAIECMRVWLTEQLARGEPYAAVAATLRRAAAISGRAQDLDRDSFLARMGAWYDLVGTEVSNGR